ncbi:MAG: lamin tail domain-containing protein, partial [Phycisphaerae bacterium]|nr:lamin tail domain-containing protein [Phycisphaerae bacterium]
SILPRELHPGQVACFEALEARLLLAADPIITEFMAINDSTLQDEDLDYSDWMEIHNAGDAAVDLAGWHLTDDAGDLTRWTFPTTNLPAGGYLIVFASGKDRSVSGSELHTNFALSGDGEYLALVQPGGGTVAHDYGPQFPNQAADLSYGIGTNIVGRTLLATEASANVLVPSDGSFGLAWTGGNEPFDASAWIYGPTGVGFETETGYEPLIDTDVETEMYGVNSSVYIRLPFAVEDPGELATMTLKVKYDDGLAAYLNGTAIASRNAPVSPQWDSQATAEHPDAQAIVYEEIDISAFIGDLEVGSNILAIHGLNLSAGDADFLVDLEIEASGPDIGYFTSPTPGVANGATGYLGMVGDTTFSVDRGFFDASFDVQITTSTPGATIRYTTDYTWPTESVGTIYSGAISVATTTVLRAIAYKPGYLSTNVDTQTYIFLGDVVNQPGSPAGFPSTWGTYPSG